MQPLYREQAMPSITIRNVPVKPEVRVKLGSFLASIARETGALTEEEHAILESVRDKSPARAASFE